MHTLPKISMRKLHFKTRHSHEYFATKIMTSKPDKSSSGNLPPMPVTELTMEQEFNLRQLEDLLKRADKEDIITVFLALQHQCHVMRNTIEKLVQEWPM